MESIQGLLDSLAGAGPAVAALAVVFFLVWRQFCNLQAAVIATIKEQAAATEKQAQSNNAEAQSNNAVAQAVAELKNHLAQQASGDASYRTGMQEFAKMMTGLAQGIDKKATDTLHELKEHRDFTEKRKAH